MGGEKDSAFTPPTFPLLLWRIKISVSTFPKILNPKGKQGLRGAGGLPGWGKDLRRRS